MTKDEFMKFIDTELQGNLNVLIDPKKKDSLSQDRINVWKSVVAERIYYYVTEKGFAVTLSENTNDGE